MKACVFCSYLHIGNRDVGVFSEKRFYNREANSVAFCVVQPI